MARKVWPLWLILSAGCTRAPPAPPPPVTVGQVVRVAAPDVGHDRITGTLLAVGDQRLTLAVDDARRVEVPVDAVRSLAIRTGTRRHTAVGALIGLGAGIAVFFVADAAEGGCDGDPNCESMRGAGFAILSGGGLALGALVGLLVRTDRWEERPVPVGPPVDGSAPGLARSIRR